MMRRVLAVAGLLSLTAANGPKTPTSQWRIDYGETQCLALRLYGDDILMLRPDPTGKTYELLYITPEYMQKGAVQWEGSVTFGDRKLGSTALVYSDPETRKTTYKYRLSAAQMEQARGATRVVLEANTPLRRRKTGSNILSGSSRTSDLALTQMSEVLDGLGKCLVELRQYWNADVKPAVSARSVGDVRSVFTTDDYPADAIILNQSGSTQSLLLVDTVGNVAGCYNIVPSGIAVLDAKTCDIFMTRAHFEPARDKDGKPMRDIYVTPPVKFQMSR